MGGRGDPDVPDVPAGGPGAAGGGGEREARVTAAADERAAGGLRPHPSPAPRHVVLIVDDEVEQVRAFTALLRHWRGVLSGSLIG